MRAQASRWLRAVGDGLAELLYPARCFGCGGDVRAPGLCGSCESALQHVRPPFCSICGEPFDGAIKGTFVCANCSGMEFGYDFAISGYLATGPLRHLVHNFKYHRRLTARRTLAELLEPVFDDPRVGALVDPLIVPVPLHPRRQRERGYNQAVEIASLLARSRDLPYCDALIRTRYTSAQARLVRDQRLANLRSAIQLRASPGIRERVDGATILLVDDVFTTGATADACAQILRQHGGAEKVVVATVARG